MQDECGINASIGAMMNVSWRIGNIPVNGRLVLAPMARITDLPFRLLCRSLCASLAFTEMVNVNAICRCNKAALGNAFTVPADRPLGIQLFGTQPAKFLAAAQAITNGMESPGHVFIDVNLDCPDEAVIRQGAGAALLMRPERVSAIINTLATKQPLPVTAKMRLASMNVVMAVKTARNIEAAGAAAIAVHARAISQGNAGDARWDIIEAIKDAVAIPVIGNGGIVSPAFIDGEVAASHCDAAMIGKAAIYTPGVFLPAPPGAKHWAGGSGKERLAWLQAYCKHASDHGCLDARRAEQRARDFFKQQLPPGTIDALLANATGIPSFLTMLEQRLGQGKGF